MANAKHGKMPSWFCGADRRGSAPLLSSFATSGHCLAPFRLIAICVGRETRFWFAFAASFHSGILPIESRWQLPRKR